MKPNNFNDQAQDIAGLICILALIAAIFTGCFGYKPF